VSPAQLPHNCIFPIFELLAYRDGMIATFAIVFGILFFGSIFGDIVLGGGRGR
jgi:hypothetical protein